MPTLTALIAPSASASIWSDLFTFEIPPWEKVIRTVAVYLVIAVVIRIAGKRLMAQMNSLDLVVVLLLSNVVQNAIIGADNSLIGGLLGAVVLITVNALLEHATERFEPLRHLLEGRSTTVITDGTLEEGVLARLGMSPDELHSALRHQGAASIRQVKEARIEPGGSITVDLKERAAALEAGEFEDAIEDLRRSLADIRAKLDRFG